MRSYALLLASAASAYPVAPRRALRINALRAAPEVSEQQSWMIDYMAKAHTARLEAVQRAKAEAAAEMEARIKELEAQIAAMRPALAVSRDDSCDSCDERAEDDGPQSPVGSMLRFSQIALGTRGRMMSYRV